MRTVDWRMLWEEHAEPGHMRRVLCALSVSMGGDGGQRTNCSPSMERIARRVGMRRDAASHWLAVAEKEGWINVGRITGLRNRYWASVPPLLRSDLKRLTEEREKAQPPKRQERKFTERRSKQKCPVCGEVSVKKGYHNDAARRDKLLSGERPMFSCSAPPCSWWNTTPDPELWS